MPYCRRLFLQAMVRAALLAWISEGSINAAKIAMIAITTSNSMSVNAALPRPHFTAGHRSGRLAKRWVACIFISSLQRHNPVKPVFFGGNIV